VPANSLPSRTTTSNQSAPAPPTSTRYAATYAPALNDCNPKRVKGVLQATIDGIRADARDQIESTFRVPVVRIESGFMELGGLEPPTSWVRLS